MPDAPRRLAIDTTLQRRLTRPPKEGGEPVVPPIWQTATYALPSPEIGAALSAAVAPPTFYTRYGSPNVAEVEAHVAALEGAETALAVGSGMAAIACALGTHLKAGDHMIAQTAHYTGSLSLMTDWLPRQGVAVTQVEQTDLAAFAAAVRPETRLIHIETPVNPTMALTDIAGVAEIAKTAGAVLTIDNTFASSFNQTPHALGADIVIHSATKFLNGHSDVTAGVATGSRATIERMWEHARVHGPVLHPMEAWLLGRGLKTYALRMRRHNASALAVAQALSETDGIAAVHYPGLPAHPQHALAKKQMPGGFGGMLSFEVAGDDKTAYARAKRVLERVEICVSAVSLGAVETLITHPASMIFAHQDAGDMAALGVAPGLLRLSVGLEDPGDLIDDLTRALQA